MFDGDGWKIWGKKRKEEGQRAEIPVIYTYVHSQVAG